ncbi:MAG: cytochrome c3 family protein, partial [Dehalococcoidia bacterium]
RLKLTGHLWQWMLSLSAAVAVVVGIVLSAGAASGALSGSSSLGWAGYAAADEGGLTFDRRLSGDGVGQHKAPPDTYVTMEVSVSTEAELATAALADYFPASWLVSDAREGVISQVDEATSKIEWELGDISAGGALTREYILLSPERTIPPTRYQFWSELGHSEGSATSDPWDVTVADPPPKAPETPYSKGTSSTSIAVAWVPSPTSDIDGYKIYRSANGTDYFLLATLSDGQLVSSYVDTGLPASALYYYKISAWRGAEETSQTSATSASTTAPDPPRGLRATGGTGSISLAWNANTESNLIGYNVYRATASEGSFSKINPSLVTTTSYVDSTPPVGSAVYYYRMSAVDATAAEGGMSAEAWARPYYNPASGGPHIAYPVTTDVCATCHRTHLGRSPKLFPTSAEKDLCFTCHDSSGSQYNIVQEFVSPISQHPVPDETLKCSSCHNAHINWQDYPKLLSADGQHSGNAVCYTCHGAADPNLPAVDYQTPFEAGFHKPYISNSPTGTQIQCASCHRPHASAFRSLEIRKDENGCLSCHDGSTVGGDVFSNFAASGDAEAHHDIFDADQSARGTRIECVNCHNPHTVGASGSIKKVINPENPSPASSSRWSDTIPAFCVTCHDDAFPTSIQTEPFAPAPQGPSPPLTDVKEAWYWGSDGKADQMGDGTSSASLDPAMGYTAGEAALSCQTCHDLHGTANPLHLRTKVYSKDQTTFKEGLIVIGIAGGGYDFRFFCNACHDRDNMGNKKSLPTDCTAGNCHFHGGAF